MIPAWPRLAEISKMIEGGFYFGLRSPRLSGKPAAAPSSVRAIDDEGRYRALHCSMEPLRGQSDVDKAMSYAPR